jgi:hypothetical protein
VIRTKVGVRVRFRVRVRLRVRARVRARVGLPFVVVPLFLFTRQKR